MTLKLQESQTQTIFIALLGSFILLFVLMAWLLFPTRISKTIPAISTIVPTITSTQTNNGDYTFTLKVPATWKFNGQVLANYDILNAEQLPYFPKGSIKCDFYPYDPSSNFEETSVFIDKDVLVKKGKVQLSPDTMLPGTSDDYPYFLFQKGSYTKGLFCYAYDETKESEFKQILSTFKFTQ